MFVSEFDYKLPAELVAQEPLPARDESRLLVLERETGNLYDSKFSSIGQWLGSGDLLVINNTRVIPARIFGELETGARVELLLLREQEPGVWTALGRPSRKLRPGSAVRFGPGTGRNPKSDLRTPADEPPRTPRAPREEPRIGTDAHRCPGGEPKIQNPKSKIGGDPTEYRATVLERRPDGMRVLRFEPPDVGVLLRQQGELALPPYIRKKCEEPERYQTVYAEKEGAVAAPTAGLHFTPAVIAGLKEAGIEFATVTLHAGLGTFRPVKSDTVEGHTMYPEEFELGEDAAAQVNRALSRGRRVVCVGTTTVRVLESQAEEKPEIRSQKPEVRGQNHRDTETSQVRSQKSEVRTAEGGWRVKAGRGETNLYIYPGYRWKVTGALLTNFHLPKSTLLMLVSAFAGLDVIKQAYEHAIAERYRFYSFGDAMLIV